MAERIIVCIDCGAMVVTKSGSTLRCKECAEKRNSYNALADEGIHFCDPPEIIQQCLNCEKPTCNNCLDWTHKTKSGIRKPNGVSLKEVQEEVVAAFKQGKSSNEIARRFNVTLYSANRWKRRLREEGML